MGRAGAMLGARSTACQVTIWEPVGLRHHEQQHRFSKRGCKEGALAPALMAMDVRGGRGL